MNPTISKEAAPIGAPAADPAPTLGDVLSRGPSAKPQLAHQNLSSATLAGDLAPQRRLSTRPCPKRTSGAVVGLRPKFAGNPIGGVVQALAEDRVAVFYQSQHRANDLSVVGFEALFRMWDETGERVAPGTFMGALERSNAIYPVTQFVTDRTCRDLAGWRGDSRDLHGAVNVCANDLMAVDFVSKIQASLARHNLPVRALELEVVERDPIEPGSVAARNIRSLIQLGVGISIDDFGSGHANELRLARMPANKLKLDRSLVARTPHEDRARRRVANLVELAHARAMTVVAEGVETSAELDVMRSLGCDLVQGYLLSKPQRATEIEVVIGMLEESV